MTVKDLATGAELTTTCACTASARRSLRRSIPKGELLLLLSDRKVS